MQLVAYAYGGLIWKEYGWAFLIHLLLSEWRDVSYVLIKVIGDIQLESIMNTKKLLLRLHYADAVCVMVAIPFCGNLPVWQF